MGDLRRDFYVELMHRVLQDTVGIGHALVLTQMLKPRFNEECFQILPFSGRMFKDTPCINTWYDFKAAVANLEDVSAKSR